MSKCEPTRTRGNLLLRWTLATAGVLSVGVGALGAVLPGLPTTIFLIFACWCFTRSCPWLERRLIRENRLFAPFLVYLQPGAPMPRRARIAAIVVMWIAVFISVASLSRTFDASSFLPEAIIAAAVIGTVFILTFRQARPEVHESVSSTLHDAEGRVSRDALRLDPAPGYPATPATRCREEAIRNGQSRPRATEPVER